MKVQIDKHIVDKINDAHDGVVQSSKDAIQYALYAGRELNKLKEQAEHGQFMSDIKMTFKFSHDTALRYMKVADYSANIAKLRNLQEAYKLIESEESKKKQAEKASQHERLIYRKKHNEKPSTWQRSDDYAWAKMKEEDKARDERIADYKQKMQEESERKERKQQQYDDSFNMLNDFIASEKTKQEDMNKMRISNQNGTVLDYLRVYLDSLDTDSQKIEECHNIIKYCKDEARKLQVKSVK